MTEHRAAVLRHRRRLEMELLRRVIAAGNAGDWMHNGEENVVVALADRGLLRWEQSSPFVARIFPTTTSADGLQRLEGEQ